MLSSTQNPLIKRIVSLKNRKERRQEGVFLIEGEKEVLLALAGGVSLEILVYCPELIKNNTELNTVEAIEQRYKRHPDISITLVEVTPRVYARIAYRDKVEGLVAVACTPERTIEECVLPDNPLLLIVDGIEKPGNLGALLRTADGAGVDAVFVCGDCIDLYNPNVVRASLGALFTVNIFQMQSGEMIAWLKRKKFNIILSTPAGDQDYSSQDYTGPTAIVLGSEDKGISEQWLQLEARTVRIPMQGRMDSLNVSASGAVLVYEAVRQRSK
ncbi:MAG: RNA methyltransferase [Sedimentisphaerales bacterium]|nr:RNA methyltransferase [Sedimentisphaerales bacterium]